MTTLRTTRARAAGVLTVITMTAVLAACSSGGNDDGADMSLSEPTGASEGAGSGASDSASDAGGRRASEDAAGRELAGQSGGATGSPGSPTGTATERAVISSGTVSLTSKDVAGARRDVQRIVDAQGGEVTEEDTETDDEGETSYARMVLRVPSPAFDEAMQALEDVAVLRASNRGSEDVTTQVIDTGVRVRAQQASLERVELLLAEADTLKEVIWIESQLTDRQAELDSLKSQQSWLRDQTSLSTITVDITRTNDVKAEEPDDEPAGFLTGLRGGLDALGSTAVAVATVVGALLPFAVVLLVVGLPVWLLLRRRRTTPQPAAPEA